MGAVAPIFYNSAPCWIPQDDLLLKNAVEAGASLESLAKGAVRFSQQFTVQELHDRWQSLLYDPVTSSSASACMVGFEYPAALISPQSKKMDSCKGSGFHGKRKNETIRNQYYAMRKRICTEPFNSNNLSFFVAPNSHNDSSNRVGFQEQLLYNNHHMNASCTLEDPVGNHYELPENNFDMVHGFPLVHARTDVNDIDGILGGDELYGFTGNVSRVTGSEAINSEREHSFQHNDMHPTIISNILQESLPQYGNSSTIQEMGPPRALPVTNIFKDDALITNPFPDFDSTQDNSGYELSQGFSSPISDCGAQFHQLGCPPPLPVMPIWRTREEIAALAGMIDENDLSHMHSSIVQGNVYDKMSLSGYHFVHSKHEMKDLGNLSNSLSNIADEEVLFFEDVDGKDMIDKSFFDNLNSMFLSCPNDAVHEDDIPSITELTPHIVTSAAALSGELKDTGGDINSGTKKSDIIVLSKTLASLPSSPERVNGIVCCVLNTEDPDIPSNEDWVLPFVSSVMQRDFRKTGCSDLKITSDFHNENGVKTLKEEEIHVPYRRIGPQRSSEVFVGEPGSRCQVPKKVQTGVTLRNASSMKEKQSLSKSFSLTAYTDGKQKDNCTDIKDGERYEFDHNHRKQNPSVFEAATEGSQSLGLEANPGPSELDLAERVDNPSSSEQDEQDNENEVPYFSDIEAMILDMDLEPFEGVSRFHTEVPRYQHEDSKRAIVRLEQGAHSFMQRAIASHSSFAVLYGRHLKYYIKKTEVLLGRATEDFYVDIDLGREGRANKISRRQAIVKMEEDGSFWLRNLGKFPIFVCSTEVSTGQCVRLTSSCLIEIRDMRFLFDINPVTVKQYLSKNVRKMRNQNNDPNVDCNFDWTVQDIAS